MKKPLLSELSLREKIGQTALGRPSNKGYTDLKKYPYGCIWGMGNIRMDEFNMNDEAGERVTARMEWLHKLERMNRDLRIPMLQAMDCTSGINHFFSELEPHMDPVTIGAADSEELAYEGGRLRGAMLRSVGSRWAWFHEVDRPNRACTVMLGRQYSDDPDKLLAMNIADMKGCHEMGVAACAKHFPGADGMEYRDPHTCQSTILLPMEEWWEWQGKIFQGMVDAGVDSVMICHAAFPFCDNTTRNGNYVPASLSYKVITELLKNKMGFKGVVITDGIGMRGVSAYCDDNMDQVYVEAIKAGNDVVLGVNDSYFDAIEQAVLTGEIPESRIDDACQRVLDMKEKYGFFDRDFAVSCGDPAEINAWALDYRRRVARKAVSLVCDKKGLFPLAADKIKHVTIVYSGHDKTGGGRAFDHLKVMQEAFERRGATVEMHRRLQRYPDRSYEIKEVAPRSDLIVYVGHLLRGAPDSPNHFFGDELNLFRQALLLGVDKSVGIGLGSPFMYFDYYSAFPAFINAYNYTAETLEAVVAAMYGEIGFEGGTPFELLPPHFKRYLDMLKERES